MPDSVVGERRVVREIEASPVPERFARGWHCLGLARDFKDGRPHQVEAFGAKLAVFQDSTGKLNVLDAFCRHMGGNLADGRIVGDAVACPFHDWRWAGDGRCVGVPYAKRIPPGAQTRAWPVHEINGHLIVWHDPEGNPPLPEQMVPRIDGAYSDAWSDWGWCDAIIENHPRELIDNMADMAHFFYVHGERKRSMPGYFKNVFHDHFATQYLEQGSDDAPPTYKRDEPYLGDPDKIDGILRSELTWNGPAYSIDHLWWRMPEGLVYSILFLGILPLEPKRFRLFNGVLTRKDPKLSDSQNEARHQQNFEWLRFATFQDVAIWKGKARIDNPLLCDGDGPVYRLRTWYDQFYTDIDKIRPQSVAPFEKAVDTRHANEVWARQLAAEEE